MQRLLSCPVLGAGAGAQATPSQGWRRAPAPARNAHRHRRALAAKGDLPSCQHTGRIALGNVTACPGIRSGEPRALRRARSVSLSGSIVVCSTGQSVHVRYNLQLGQIPDCRRVLHGRHLARARGSVKALHAMTELYPELRKRGPRMLPGGTTVSRTTRSAATPATWTCSSAYSLLPRRGAAGHHQARRPGHGPPGRPADTGPLRRYRMSSTRSYLGTGRSSCTCTAARQWPQKSESTPVLAAPVTEEGARPQTYSACLRVS